METPLNGTEIQPLVTTVGRRTGKPHTVQIRVYYWHGRLIATTPYPRIKRDWIQNVMADPGVSIESGSVKTRARAEVITRDPETTEQIAIRRISWRGAHCPLLVPEGTSFVEFFPEEAPEALFRDALITHSPELDPLAAPTLSGVIEWQNEGNWHRRQPTTEQPTSR
ncbi:MAG: F420H(2)-dependent quinone reductase [Chloroflexi bacterium]|nr:F420H(2)-dependent quinone reductase [Chloroflexota bacterium]